MGPRLSHLALLCLLILAFVLAGCNLSLEGVETEIPLAGDDETAPPTLAPATTPAEGDFFIVITAPTPPATGEPVTVSSAGFTVAGEQRGSFENNVVVQALDNEGNVLQQVATTATGEPGQVGTWQVSLSPTVPAGTPGMLYAFFTSAQDGSVVAEASVPVIYDGGAETSG